MNNLLSNCGLVDARLSASDKDLPVQIKDIVGIVGDTSSTFKEKITQSQELERSEDDEGVDSDGIFEDIENDDLSLSDDEPKVKKRIKRKGN